MAKIKIMKNELNIVAAPGGTLQLEWSEIDEVVAKSQALLQDEIYERFTSDPVSSLLFLGFRKKGDRKKTKKGQKKGTDLFFIFSQSPLS